MKIRHLSEFDFFCHPVAIFTYLALFLRICKEIVDLIAHKEKYFLSVENWLQILIILSTATFFYLAYVNVKYGTHCAAWAIALMWMDFTLTVGRLNDMGEYIFMVVNVTKKLVKFLGLYIPVMMAFTFGMHILNNQVRAYSGVWTSFLRTFVHMTGESEFTSHFQWHEVKDVGGSQISTQVICRYTR